MEHGEPAGRPTIAPALAEYTGYLLRRAYALAAEAAAAAIPPPHHIRDVAILASLAARGPMSQQELAQLGQVNRTIMAKLVAGLEERGLVTKTRNPRDRRAAAVAITAEGRRTLRALQPAVRRGDARLTANLSTDERDTLNALLRAVLDSWPADLVETLCTRTGYLVSRAHAGLRAWGTEALRPLGIEPRHFGVLATLDEEQPCSQQHLARRLGVSAPVILEMVEALEKGGLVHRVRNRDDRRAYDLTLTPAGVERVQAAREAASGVQQHVSGCLGRVGDRELRRLLSKLVDPHADAPPRVPAEPPAGAVRPVRAERPGGRSAR